MPGLTLDLKLGQAIGNPLVRGGLMIGAGIVLGNLIGFVRVAVTAYLLGTHSAADALAVAISPVDTLNTVLTNTMIFAFVPMLTLRQDSARADLFRQAGHLFTWMFGSVSVAIMLCAPWLIHILGPGLAPEYIPASTNVLRIVALSTFVTGSAAIQSALLFTERRFGPTAFYQASLNLFTIVAALTLWRFLGIYAFAFGYLTGACVQFAVVDYFARKTWVRRAQPAEPEEAHWKEMIAKPGSFLIYAGLLALNMIVTRAYATQAGPGMAAAFDYTIRCLNVVVAYLVSPVSNSLLPEIARLKSLRQTRQALHIVDKTLALAASGAVASCLIGVLVRRPVIAFLFERGSFTAESTRLVSGVFLGLAPAVIGLSLLELTSRSLFSLDHAKLPLYAVAIPVTFNLIFSSAMRTFAPQRFSEPQFLGLGASLGLLLSFGFLFFLVRNRRGQWLRESTPDSANLVPVSETQF